MSIPISLEAGNNSSNSQEDYSTMMQLFLPSVGAGAVVYGDEDDRETRGRYVAFIEREEVNYPAQPWFFWNQPLDDSGWVGAHFGLDGPSATTAASNAPTASASKGKGQNSCKRSLLGPLSQLFPGAATLISLYILLFV
jgi:hypothetical protein